MPKLEEQLKDTIHRLNQIKPEALDSFVKGVTERAKTDPRVAQALALAGQLKEQSRGLDVVSPVPPSAGTAKLTTSDWVVIILLILLFP